MESYFQWNRLTAAALTAALLLWGSSALAAEKVVVLQPDSDTATEAEVNELAAALRAQRTVFSTSHLRRNASIRTMSALPLLAKAWVRTSLCTRR